MRKWGMLALGLVAAALFGTTGLALAAPQVSLDATPDGTLTLVGRGWQPGQHMVVSVGRDLFPALADSVGDFEVQTGLVAGSPPVFLAVHRPDARLTLAPIRADTPHPFAVLFAQSLMTGTIWLTLSAAGLGLAAVGARYLRPKPDPRG